MRVKCRLDSIVCLVITIGHITDVLLERVVPSAHEILIQHEGVEKAVKRAFLGVTSITFFTSTKSISLTFFGNRIFFDFTFELYFQGNVDFQKRFLVSLTG